MNGTERLNPVIDLLDEGRVVFGTRVAALGMNPVGTRSVEAGLGTSDSQYDMVIFDMEHQWFDLPGLSVSLQFLLDRGRIAASGSLRASPAPLVRLPANAREHNQWMIKQALDAGVYGVVVPQLESVEEARAMVVACRYPQALGAPDSEPAGERGFWSSGAPRYWGTSVSDYHGRADLWPLDPAGELLLMPMIETELGVRQLPRVLDATPGIGAVWAGYGDLAVSLGHATDLRHADVEAALLQIVSVCKDFGRACAIVASPADVAERIEQGFDIILTSAELVDSANSMGREIAGR